MKRLCTVLSLSLWLGVFTACSTSATGNLDAACTWQVEPLMTPPAWTATHRAPASPFPSNLYSVPADTATGLRNDVQGQGLLFQDTVNRQDGWAPHGPIRIAFSGTIDPASLPATVTDSTQPDSPIQLIAMDGSFDRVPFQIRMGQEHSYVYLSPYLPMQEETSYAIVVRGGLEPQVGECMRRNPKLQALLHGETSPYLPQHTQASILDTWQQLAEQAETTGIPADDILLAVPYTTQSISRSLLEKRAQILGQEIVPTVTASYSVTEDDGAFNKELQAALPPLPASVTLGEDIALHHISHVVMGEFDAADYRRDFKWAEAPQRINRLQFLLALPRIESVKEEYVEALGTPVRFPTIIFGHGLTACKETLLGVANRFARYGLAVAGIDVIEHGHRITDPNDNCGSGITEGLRLLRFADVEIGRDNFRQTVLDEIQFIHMLAGHPETNYLAAATDDTSGTSGLLAVERFGYIGQSLGGILGGVLTTVEPRITTAVLNVPGGGLTDLAILAEPGSYQPFDLQLPDGLLYENLAGLQTIMGPADPLYYAPYTTRLTPPAATQHSLNNILLQQGMDDEIMAAYLTENLGRALGATHITPIAQAIAGVDTAAPPYRGQGPVTVAHQQYVVPPEPTEEDARNWNSHYLLIMANDPDVVRAAQYQSAHFLWTGLFQDKAQVIDGLTIHDDW